MLWQRDQGRSGRSHGARSPRQSRQAHPRRYGLHLSQERAARRLHLHRSGVRRRAWCAGRYSRPHEQAGGRPRGLPARQDQDRRFHLQEPGRPQGVAVDRRSRMPRIEARRCAGLRETLQFSHQHRRGQGRRHRGAGRRGSHPRQGEIGRDTRMGNQARGNPGEGRMKKVAVLLGGLSAEREVSLVSGRACAKALREEGFDVVEIDARENLETQLLAARPDVVFNALHGRWGEDGCVQGVLELLRIPYTHSGVLASALAMHKQRAKDVFAAAGLPIVNSLVADRREAGSRHLMEPPYVIKPVNEGSSVGVYIIRKGDNRPPAELGSDTWQLSDLMMVEEYVPGRELTVAVMGGRALAVTEIVPKTAFYDYEAKYAEGGSAHVIPANVPPEVAEKAMRIAEKAHEILGCRGVSRADFRYDDSGTNRRLILLEVNTQPGMTPTSLVPEQ